MEKDDQTTPGSYVRSIARATSILEQFTLDRPKMRLTEISNAAGLSKSTTYRMLSTLEKMKMVDFDKETATYRLGLKIFQLGRVASGSIELIQLADPLLRNLAQETGETSSLLVADGNEALCLVRFDGNPHVRDMLQVAGERSALNCGAAQRTLLAHLPQWQWEEVISDHVLRMTQYSLGERMELERDRREITERGYSVGWEDMTLHVCTLGVPVRDVNGAVVAAVAISGIVQRFSAEKLPMHLRLLMEMGEELSCRLGYADRD